jgi:hypothetical protein
MSAVTSRPRVRRVSTRRLSASDDVSTTRAPLTHGDFQALLQSLDASLASRVAAVPRIERASPSALQSISRARREQVAAEKRVFAASAGTQPLEAVKVAALAGVAAASFAVSLHELEPAFRALAAATSIADADRARADLQQIAEAAHLNVLSASVAAACREACHAVGYHDVCEQPDAMTNGLRVVGIDTNGRAIVSEVHVNGEHVCVESEIVGVADGSCREILDGFDDALEAAGVQADRARSYTGGVPCLTAARQFAERWSSAASPRSPAHRKRYSNAQRAPVKMRA